MAILYSARGRMSGSVGNDTFRKGEDNKTIMSAKVVEQTNPRTYAQAAQRVKFATCGKAYKFLKSIVNHSFTGIKDGSKCYQHFMKINLPDLNTEQGAYAKAGQYYAQRPYIIATGPIVSFNNIIGDTTDGYAALNLSFSTFPTGASLTLAQLQEIFPELLPGMELALVMTQGSGVEASPALFKSRITISANATPSSVVGSISSGVITLGGEGISSMSGKIVLTQHDDATCIGYSEDAFDYWSSAAIIFSRRGFGEVEYSDAMLVLKEAEMPFETLFETAVLDYQATDDKFLDQVDK